LVHLPANAQNDSAVGALAATRHQSNGDTGTALARSTRSVAVRVQPTASLAPTRRVVARCTPSTPETNCVGGALRRFVMKCAGLRDSDLFLRSWGPQVRVLPGAQQDQVVSRCYPSVSPCHADDRG
jgi:hypothetical protein